MPSNYPVEKWYSFLKGSEKYYNDNALDLIAAIFFVIPTLALPLWLVKPFTNITADTLLK